MNDGLFVFLENNTTAQIDKNDPVYKIAVARKLFLCA